MAMTDPGETLLPLARQVLADLAEAVHSVGEPRAFAP